MIKVLIADDHAVVRRGMMQILDEAPGICCAGEAGNGLEVLKCVDGGEYDVLLLDMAMPEMNGLETLRQLRSRNIKLKVLILSMYPEEQFALRTMRAGASGYLTKDSAPDILIEAIRKVSAGGKYITNTLAEKLADEISNKKSNPIENLSDREYQVLRHLSRGRTISEIAEELSVSNKTVYTYRTRILRKMNLRNTSEIVHYIYEQGLEERLLPERAE